MLYKLKMLDRTMIRKLGAIVETENKSLVDSYLKNKQARLIGSVDVPNKETKDIKRPTMDKKIWEAPERKQFSEQPKREDIIVEIYPKENDPLFDMSVKG